MYLLRFFLLILFVPHVYLQSLVPKAGVNYGPYDIEVSYYGSCSNTGKQNNISQVVVDFHRTSKLSYVAKTNVTLFTTVQFDAVNLAVYREDDDLNALWRYKVKSPCQHPILRPFTILYYNADKRCNVQKGNYYPQLLIGEQAKAFLGDQFFYGAFTFKLTVFNKKFILFCLLAKCKFVKKT